MISASNDNSGAGADWVYTNPSSGWAEQAKIPLPDPSARPFGSSVGISYDRHEDPPVLRPLAEWALVTATGEAVAVEFRQVPYGVEEVRAAAERSGRPFADEWSAQWKR